jgi:hypothetical protein
MIIRDPNISELNTFIGGATQQATSVVTNTNPNCYELEGGCYSVYGFEVFLSDVCADVTLTPFTVSTRYLNLEIIESIELSLSLYFPVPVVSTRL